MFASEHDEQTSPHLNEDNSSNPDWVHVLTEECRELRQSNIQLQDEADQLRKETAEVELKEKELVQQCLEQFSESSIYYSFFKFVLCIQLKPNEDLVN